MNTMIGISVSTYDLSGATIINKTPSTEIQDGERRVSRTKTLDGGCAIYDGGFSHADRTWSIEAVVSDQVWEILWAIMTTYSLVRIATAEGFFVACLESAARSEDKAILSILIKEKLA